LEEKRTVDLTILFIGGGPRIGLLRLLRDRRGPPPILGSRGEKGRPCSFLQESGKKSCHFGSGEKQSLNTKSKGRGKKRLRGRDTINLTIGKQYHHPVVWADRREKFNIPLKKKIKKVETNSAKGIRGGFKEPLKISSSSEEKKTSFRVQGKDGKRGERKTGENVPKSELSCRMRECRYRKQKGGGWLQLRKKQGKVEKEGGTGGNFGGE